MHPSKKGTACASDKNSPVLCDGGGAGDWSFFDRIYCISLVNREDRRVEAKVQFDQVGLASRVEFVLVHKHLDNPEQGIYESHLLCMEKGLASGARRILIFEDDVVFLQYSPERLAQLVRCMQTHPGWDMFFLGCMVRNCWKLRNFPAARIRYRSLTHAYAITQAFAKTLTRQYPWHNVAYDDFLRDLKSERMYVAYPALAFQSDSPSDNDVYLSLDRMRRLCGGLIILQQFDQWYHRYRWQLITLHVLALAALAAFIWLPIR
ncbi:MAG: glycosyltransferase [Desulfobulbaceae bacterium]|nr:glycosyltransferase [Desulfobulbaceae bacterium]